MRATSRLALLAAAALLGSGCAEPPSARVENAVLICLDTVRQDTLAMVHEVAAGDVAARRWNAGTRLVRVQSTAPWTLPAVASVFTGLYPNEHRAGAFLREVADLTRGFPLPLAKGLPTLASRLSAEGFETAGFVAHSWFRRRFGLDRGFESLDLGLESAQDLVGRVGSWLDAHSAKAEPPPFFLYLHFMEAHRPMHLGEALLRPRVARLSPPLRERAIAANPMVCADPTSLSCARYLGYVEAVAELHGRVAQVLDALEARGLLANTVVAVFSDHGEEFLEHAALGAARALDPRGSYGIGHGHTLYQEQLHVPVAFWHPALTPGESDVPASLVDLAPTLLAWLGVDPRGPLAGEDLGPKLSGEVPPDLERPLFSSSVAFGPEREAVVRGGHKRIGDGGSGAGALVFDLNTDPNERAPADTDADRGLEELLARYRARLSPGGQPATPTPAELEELQALGYLEDATAE